MSNRLSMLFLVIVISCLRVSGQGNSVKALNIGDAVPDITIKNIINAEKSSIRFGELKNKIVILDFWTTWCAPCIAAFPKMDEMQKKFKDKLQIIPVTYEKKLLVTNFMNKYKASQGLSPMSATDDTLLRKMFPHNSFPHYVIIGADSKVIAITSGDNINEENISKILGGNIPKLWVKDDAAGFEVAMTDGRIFTPGVTKRDGNYVGFEKINYENVLTQSVLTKYVEGVWPGARQFPGYLSAKNMSPRMLYGVVIGRGGLPVMPDIESNDPALWKRLAGRLPGDSIYMHTLEEKKKWIAENTYMYEIKVPVSVDSTKFDIMLDELNRAFGPALGIRCDIENKPAKYLALILEDSVKLKKKSAGLKDLNPEEGNKFSAIVSNDLVDRLFGPLVTTLQKYNPIVDETGYSQRVNIRIDANLFDLNDINKKLAEYGLKFVQKEKIQRRGTIRLIK